MTKKTQPTTDDTRYATADDQQPAPRFRAWQALLIAVVLVPLGLLLATCSQGQGQGQGTSTGPVDVPGLFVQSEIVLLGTVSNAYSDEPVSDATIATGEHEVNTSSSGVYRIEALKPAELRAQELDITAPGYEAVSIPLAPYTEDMPEATSVITIDATLRPDTLTGLVTDSYTEAPVAGASVQAATGATSIDASAPLSTTTSATGSYTLTGVTEAVTLTVNASGYAPVQETLQRQVRYDVVLQPDVLTGTVTDLYSDEPISGTLVQVETLTTTTTPSGTYRLAGLPPDAPGAADVVISAEGYAPITRTLTRTTQLDAALRPTTLTATLLDMQTSIPITNATIIATETLTSTATAFERIDNSTTGRFTLEDVPEQGYLQVLAPGYRKAVLELTPGSIPQEIALEPFFARSIYAKTNVAAHTPTLMRFFDEIDRTELNAIVIDLKSDNMADLGLIYYQSNVPIIKELGTSEDRMDIRAILAEAKRRDIYTIARIHIFAHDNLLAETKPEWAAQDPNGCVPNENRLCNGDIFYADWDIAWLDPWNRNVWDYNIQLGLEAAQLGFDEIQFDYIRFPNDAANLDDMQLSQPVDYQNPQPMYENIATLLEQAHHAFNSVGAFFSVDIFGYAVWSPQPVIGQNARMMAEHSDYIYPMVYPSHFLPNEMGFDNVAAHPYEIVYESLVRGEKLTHGKRALMRPWLQDFTLLWVPSHLIVHYGPAEVRAQIDAVEEFPTSAGWALWDSDNDYTYEALEPE
jgi:hypothetical protein